MRIIVADTNQKTRWALIMVLQEEPGMEIVGEVGDAIGLEVVAEIAAADLILLDKKLAGDQIKPLISKLRALEPRPKIVVMSSDSADSRLMLKAGADAFVSKGDRPEWLVDVLRSYAMRLREGAKWS